MAPHGDDGFSNSTLVAHTTTGRNGIVNGSATTVAMIDTQNDSSANVKPKDLRSSQPSRAELMTKLQQQRDEDATTFTNKIEEMEVNQQKYINELHVDHQRAMDELKDDHHREMDTIHAEMKMLKQLVLQGHGYSVPDPFDS
ncbi:hypothetical protein Dimus_022487 [Dionaea muscipula]